MNQNRNTTTLEILHRLPPSELVNSQILETLLYYKPAETIVKILPYYLGLFQAQNPSSCRSQATDKLIQFLERKPDLAQRYVEEIPPRLLVESTLFLYLLGSPSCDFVIAKTVPVLVSTLATPQKRDMAQRNLIEILHRKPDIADEMHTMVASCLRHTPDLRKELNQYIKTQPSSFASKVLQLFGLTAPRPA
jgi:hypothetical protein